MMSYSEPLEEALSNALQSGLKSELGNTANVLNFYVDPGIAVKNPGVYIDLLGRLLPKDLVKAMAHTVAEELHRNLGLPFQKNEGWQLSDYVNNLRYPLRCQFELEPPGMLEAGKEAKIKLVGENHTQADVVLVRFDLQPSRSLTLLEPSEAGIPVAKELHPTDIYAVSINVRPTQIGESVLRATVTAIDAKGVRQTFEVPPLGVAVVEREGRVSTGSPVADRLLLGGLPNEAAILLGGPPSEERDELVRGFCSQVPSATVCVLSNVNEALDLHRLYPQLNQIVCSPQAGLLPKAPTIQTAPGVDNITAINLEVMEALRKIADDFPRVCINIVSDVLLLQKALVTRRWLSDLLPRLRAQHCTTLAVLNPRMHEVREVDALLDFFDGRMEITEQEEGGQLRRVLRVTSLRGHPYLRQGVLLSPAYGSPGGR